jgi:hypothetical protein
MAPRHVVKYYAGVKYDDSDKCTSLLRHLINNHYRQYYMSSHTVRLQGISSNINLELRRMTATNAQAYYTRLQITITAVIVTVS